MARISARPNRSRFFRRVCNPCTHNGAIKMVHRTRMPISRLLKAAPAAFFVAVTPALAQSVPNHAIAVGTGGTTFNSVGPCAVGIPVVGAGASSDPVCGQSLLVQSAPDSTQIVWPESLNNPVNAAVTGYGAGLKLQNSTPAWG